MWEALGLYLLHLNASFFLGLHLSAVCQSNCYADQLNVVKKSVTYILIAKSSKSKNKTSLLHKLLPLCDVFQPEELTPALLILRIWMKEQSIMGV